MRNDLLYIKAEQNVEVTNKKIFLEDIVKLYSTNKKMVSELNHLVFMVVKSNVNTKYMISTMKLIEMISKEYPEVTIINLGETDFILSYLIPFKKKNYIEYIKVAFVSIIIFIGSAFTIMTFNTDVNVSDVFKKMYALVLGASKDNGNMIIEISYSIGLPIGIMVFFNHFTRLKMDNDPTPIQIQMRLYEEDLNKTLIKNSSREGKTIDSD